MLIFRSITHYLEFGNPQHFTKDGKISNFLIVVTDNSLLPSDIKNITKSQSSFQLNERNRLWLPPSALAAVESSAWILTLYRCAHRADELTFLPW